jgi:hypothetical protein
MVEVSAPDRFEGVARNRAGIAVPRMGGNQTDHFSGEVWQVRILHIAIQGLPELFRIGTIPGAGNR